VDDQQELNGWLMNNAVSNLRYRGQAITAGSHWAICPRPGEPLIIAPTRAEVVRRVLVRQQDMEREDRWSRQSALDRIIPMISRK
jgi:hypothetical protein